MSYKPGQTIYFESQSLYPEIAISQDLIELKGIAVRPNCFGDALVIATHPGPVQTQVMMARYSKLSKKVTRAYALMLLLPNGQVGWIATENENYPVVTSEVEP